MSYICDNCGKQDKLIATKDGKYLCEVCKIVDEDNKIEEGEINGKEKR